MNIGEAKANVGRGVVYTPPVMRTPVWVNAVEADRDGVCIELGVAPAPKREDGVITSVNDTYVFVRYAGDMHSKATHPEHLEFLSEGL